MTVAGSSYRFGSCSNPRRTDGNLVEFRRKNSFLWQAEASVPQLSPGNQTKLETVPDWHLEFGSSTRCNDRSINHAIVYGIATAQNE